MSKSVFIAHPLLSNWQVFVVLTLPLSEWVQGVLLAYTTMHLASLEQGGAFATHLHPPLHLSKWVGGFFVLILTSGYLLLTLIM